MKIIEQLMKIQNELHVEKGQYNSFGKFNYRSLEDITEAVKPIAAKHDCVLTFTDEIVNVGDRYYNKATAILLNKDGEKIECSDCAREALSKKGMDDSQVSGTASSYARKYAAGGLFALDDTKDADTDEYHRQTSDARSEAREALIQEGKKHGLSMTDLHEKYGINQKSTQRDFEDALKKLKEAKDDK